MSVLRKCDCHVCTWNAYKRECIHTYIGNACIGSACTGNTCTGNACRLLLAHNIHCSTKSMREKPSCSAIPNHFNPFLTRLWFMRSFRPYRLTGAHAEDTRIAWLVRIASGMVDTATEEYSKSITGWNRWASMEEWSEKSTTWRYG